MAERTLDERLEAVFLDVHADGSSEAAREFAFHFRDCREDLQRLVAALNAPTTTTDADFREAVDGVLLHAVGHLVRAARMYHGLMDPFAEPTD